MNWAFWPIVSIMVSLGAFAIGYYFYNYIKNSRARMRKLTALVISSAKAPCPFSKQKTKSSPDLC